jgi:hypothetical protein
VLTGCGSLTRAPDPLSDDQRGADRCIPSAAPTRKNKKDKTLLTDSHLERKQKRRV